MHPDYMNYMGHHWILIEDNTVTVGINEDALNEIDKISEISLPTEGEEFEQDGVCGEIETSDGTYKIYAPVSGRVTEVNPDVAEEPSIIFDDPFEGWLFKIEADDESEIKALLTATSSDDDESSDLDDEDDDDESEEENDDDESDDNRH